MEDLDIATSLELPLSDEQEQKFLALKTLQAKKIKLLMISIDNKEKEISKLKFLNKDNRRTQMIQVLKNKIREFELIIDFLKEQLMNKNEMNKEEMNEYIIKKTISGPKRFRPLTREELENKIIELEKQVNILQSKQRSSMISIPSSNQNAIAPGKVSVRNISESKSSVKEISSSSNQEIDTSRYFDMLTELESLQSTLVQKNSIISTQREEILNLRQRCNELSSHDELYEQLQLEHQELQQSQEMLLHELDMNSKKLAQALEENIQVKIELSLTVEDCQQETQQLYNELQRILQQNNSLVEQLTKAEIELDSYIGMNSTQTKKESTSAAGSREVNTTAMKTYETKMIKLNEKYKALEEKCASLMIQLKQIDELKDSLREKNTMIRDLTRALEDEKNKASRNSTTTSAADGSKLATLLDENRKLKQALSMATASTTSRPTAAIVGNESSVDWKPLIESLIDSLLLTGNGLVSVHNQFSESVLQRVLDASITNIINLRQLIERLMKSHSQDQLIASKKLENLVRLCNKIEGTSELNVS